MASEPITGHVLGGPPLPNALRKKPGPKRKEKPDLATEPGHCPGCKREAASVSFELCKELIMSARDRQLETEAEQRGKAAELDLLYLAARLDGFCSLKCWRR